MIESYIFNLLIFGGIFAVLGVSLNLSMGFTGLFNLGHAAFFGIGALDIYSACLHCACVAII